MPWRWVLRRCRLLPVLAVGAVGLTGCGPAAGPAVHAAVAFHRAVAADDGAGACRLLAPPTLEELSSDGPCADAVLQKDVPQARTVRSTARFGDQAQVVLDGDVVFVAHYPDGWRVRAAACTPRADLPYDCRVSGG
jgi:hypothetical protein